MAKKGKGGKSPSERSYSRLNRHERNAIERMLDRGMSCRSIASELGSEPDGQSPRPSPARAEGPLPHAQTRPRRDPLSPCSVVKVQPNFSPFPT